MKKAIIKLAAIVSVLATIAAPVAAQKRKTTAKSREITIYVYQRPAPESGEFYGKIVAVKRRINSVRPLGAAIKLLLGGANEREEKRGLSSFIYELKLVSARVVNGTARIKFAFINPDIAEESWEGGGFDRANFNRALELTARQFPGVERVSFCIQGVQGLTDPDANGVTDCPF